MRLHEWTPAPIISPATPFETLREVTATVAPTMTVPSTDTQLMRAARLRCQQGGRERTGSDCLACARIVSIKPSPGRSLLTVRCLWTDNDLVTAVMTRAPAVVTVKATDGLGQAEQAATRGRVHHLLVLDDDVVVGTSCRCHLAEPGSHAARLRVAGFMQHSVWTVSTATSLGEAADAIARLGTGILVVADSAEIHGTVTLANLGLAEAGHVL